jgi:7-cyano-7-deazaguanine synthase
MTKQKAVVLVSGGMDSCVTAAVAARDYELYFLHINYGQLTVVDISYLKEIGGSSLTDKNIEVEEGDLNRNDIPKTYVPFRNANILAIASSWAEVIEASALFIGAVEEDGSGYPDCRRVFYDAFEKAIDEGTKPETKIKIITPLISLNKAAIVQLGKDLGAPLELSWSCYTNNDEACGVCDSCLLRLRGFEKAGYVDPIPYKQR